MVKCHRCVRARSWRTEKAEQGDAVVEHAVVNPRVLLVHVRTDERMQDFDQRGELLLGVPVA
jgi:hypothetical protein